MEKRKGDCFGDSKICSFYKPAPTITESDLESWPVVMRSNRQSNHLEYKREQEKRASGNYYSTTRKNNSYSDTSNTKGYALNNYKSDRYERVKNDNDHFAFKGIHVSEEEKKKYTEILKKIQNDHVGEIIIWLSVVQNDGGKYNCMYLLEYNQKTKSGFVKEYPNKTVSLFHGIREALERINKKNSVVIISALSPKTIEVNKPDLYTELIDLYNNKTSSIKVLADEKMSKMIQWYIQLNSQRSS